MLKNWLVAFRIIIGIDRYSKISKFVSLCSWVLMLMVLSLASSIACTSDCRTLLPKPVQEVVNVESKHGWSIVGLNDLIQDDKDLWNQAHKGECPGIAKGHFSNKNTTSFVLSFFRKTKDDKYIQRLVLLTPNGNTFSKRVIVTKTTAGSPFVVWKAPPGKYTGVYGETEVSIANDSFIYEKMEVTATQYYFKNGALLSLKSAD